MANRGAASKQQDALAMEPGSMLDLSALDGPRFLITVDTEEEFDWNKPFTRSQHGLSHIPSIDRFQKMCERYSTVPAYLVDWPIVQDGRAVDMLGSYAQSGKASIGVQLHPWVNPPFDESVNAYNSYACNLPAELERAKLTMLTEEIIRIFESQPQIYRAGRYGVGEHTPDILGDLGIVIDSSVRSRFDYRRQHGPDFSANPLNPYYLAENLIELPVTTVFSGTLRKAADHLFSRYFASDASRAFFAKSGLVERIALTPEGIPLEKAILGIDRALEEGISIMNFSLHSPSLAVGHTPYVRSESDLEELYSWWEGVFAHLAHRNVKPVAVADIAELIE